MDGRYCESESRWVWCPQQASLPYTTNTSYACSRSSPVLLALSHFAGVAIRICLHEVLVSCSRSRTGIVDTASALSPTPWRPRCVTVSPTNYLRANLKASSWQQHVTHINKQVIYFRSTTADTHDVNSAPFRCT
jgi:hypothetical protein